MLRALGWFWKGASLAGERKVFEWGAQEEGLTSAEVFEGRKSIGHDGAVDWGKLD